MSVLTYQILATNNPEKKLKKIMTISENVLREEGGCTHDHACHSHQTIDLASLQSRDGARRVFAGPGSHSITKREAPWRVRRVA